MDLNQKPKIDLVIGMHYFDGFTRKEYNATVDFTKFLIEKNMGCIYLSKAFKYHGNIYSFLSADSPSAGIIGSNNLSSITEYSRIYETSLLIEEYNTSRQLNLFINDLIKISTPFLECDIQKFNEYNPLLCDHFGVHKSKSTVKLTSTNFKIPLNASHNHTKSNLNVFFGKGRTDKRKLIKSRHWYEIELIVPSEISTQDDYPGMNSDNIFDVITDDGYTFKCKVSGDNNKNFRSAGDLKILGKWIKGRLENAGALKVGELVTNDTLSKYGRIPERRRESSATT